MFSHTSIYRGGVVSLLSGLTIQTKNPLMIPSHFIQCHHQVAIGVLFLMSYG